MATTYNVSSEGATFGNTDTATLNGAIRTIDTGPAGDYVINITGPIDLTSQLLAITGNGTSDILWQNTTTGDVDEWLINNGQWAGSIDLGTHPGNFQIAGTGSFVNGNSTSDILWHSS